MRKKPELKAHEVTTVRCSNGVGKFMGKYIIVASSTSKALSMLPLSEGEEVLRAEELKHKVFVEGRNGLAKSY